MNRRSKCKEVDGMMRHRKGFWESGVRSAAAAVAVGGACMALCTAAFAAVIWFLIGSTDSARRFAVISLAAGSFCGAYIHGKYRRKRGLLGGAVCGVLIYSALLGISLAAGSGVTDIKKLLLTTVCGAAGGVSGVNSKRPSKLMD